jgi:hypothetical protein
MPEYEAEFWHYIRLPEGGGYMMPDCGRVHMVSTESWFDRIVSADAAGIILTSLAVNRRLAANHDSGNPALTHLYMLRDAQLWNPSPGMQRHLRRAGLINDRGGMPPRRETKK